MSFFLKPPPSRAQRPKGANLNLTVLEIIAIQFRKDAKDRVEKFIKDFKEKK